MKTVEYLLILALTLVIAYGVIEIYLAAGRSAIEGLEPPIIVYRDSNSVIVLIDKATSVDEVINKCLNLLSS